MRQYNRFLLFLCNCIPGCGQLYLGYMKRGLSLMLIFAGVASITFSYVFGLELFCIVVWLYAFFDGYNLYHNLLDGTAEPDDYLVHLRGLHCLDNVLSQRSHILGWGLVLFGAYLSYFSVVYSLQSIFDIYSYYWGYEIFDILTSYIPRLAISLLLIYLGIRFIRGPKQKKPPLENDFIPPQSAQDGQDDTRPL